MAVRAQPLTPVNLAGAAVAALVAVAVLAPLAAVVVAAEWPVALGSSDWGAVRFTVLQATLSALLSTALAIPVARALARRRFWGRSALVTLMGAPFLLPVIVAVLGLLAIFGRAGLLNMGLGALGLAPVEIYGLHGIVLAHVFLNLPLAVRLLLHGWQAIPSERIRLAQTLGFTGADMRRHFEIPLLRSTVPGILLLIFLICTTSFAVALILGGGPRATTVELAIYQAFRFEFDLATASILGLLQVGLCIVAGALAFAVTIPREVGAGLDRPPMSWPGDSLGVRYADTAILIVAALFLLAPLGAVAVQGLPAVIGLPDAVWQAAARSCVIALTVAGLTAAMVVPLASLVVRLRRPGVVEGIAFLTIAVSPLVFGTGAFLLIVPLANPTEFALPVTVAVNTLVSLPFALRAVMPAMETAERNLGPLADALGLAGMARLRHVILPRIRRPLGFGMGLAAAFAMGDLGVIALFSSPGQGTLPLEMYRLMGAYRTDDAQGAALLLMLLALLAFWIFDRGGRAHAAA